MPTWNFAVVHASGKPKAVTENKPLHDLLAKLVEKFEDPQEPAYDYSKAPSSFKDRLIAGALGLAMEIERLEGKFKLGQGLSDADKVSLLRNLRSAKQARSIHDFTAGFYQRTKSGRPTEAHSKSTRTP